MSNLLEALQEVDPTAPASMADDLRACLVAINRQAQAEPPSTEWSLNAWWRWLDDEGYNREAFAEVLQRLGAARISEAQLTNLVATCGTRGDEPDGLALFQELLHEIDKDSLDLLHHFEALALTEEHELLHEAGGGRTNLSTRQKVEIGVGVPLAVGGIVGTGFAYRAWQSRRAVVNPNQIMENVNQDAIHETRYARIGLAPIELDVVRKLRNVRYDSKLLADDMLHAAENSPEKFREISVDAYNNTKGIEHLTSEDTERIVSHLVSEHAKHFIDDAVQLSVRESLMNSKNFASEFRSRMLSEAEKEALANKNELLYRELQSMRMNKNFGTYKGKDLDEALSKAEATTMDGNWFKEEFQAYSDKFSAAIRSEEMKKAEEAYKTLVSLEVEAAKKEAQKAKEAASNALDDGLIREEKRIGDVIKVSEVKIDEDVVRLAQEAKAATRKAEEEMEQNVIEIESI